MTVQCPRCDTQYRVPEERLNHRRPSFKCTRCGHVFPADRPAPRGRASEPERNLSFTFDSSEDTAVTATLRGEEPKRDAPLAMPPEPGDDEPAFVAAGSLDEPPADEIPAKPTRDRRAPDLDSDAEDDATSVLIGAPPERKMPIRPRTVLATPRPQPRRSPVGAVGIGVAATLVVYTGLALHLNRTPERTLDTLAEVPLLGRLIGDDNLLAWRLELVEVEGGLDHIKGQRQAYIVSGRAVNTTGEQLRIIEIEGKLIAGGEVRQQRRVYAANQFKKTVQELSASEVEMLLRLEPNRRFMVQPGESARFLLVFPDPPENVTGVECKVVDARPT